MEIVIGSTIKQSSDYWQAVKWLFIGLTLLKAGYIVLVFMHLGDEKKSFNYTEELLELGPSREDKYFKVPKIITE